MVSRRPAMSNFSATLRFLALPVAAVALVTGIEWFSSEGVDAPVSAASYAASGFGPRSYDQALAHTTDQIALGRERVEHGPSEWLPLESLARAHLAGAGLKTDYGDLVRAGQLLTQAKRLAPAGSGPLLTDAVYAQKTHQLDRAEASLAAIDKWAVRADPVELAETENLKGDIAFYRGDPAAARKHFERAARYGNNAGASFRLAVLAKSSGRFDDAIRHFHASNPQPAKTTPYGNASTAMQIGATELARGNYSAANSWFRLADRQFPGFWLIEAHLAQGKALSGDLPGAISAMRPIAQRAPSAEIMDALAMLLRANGQAAESRQWAIRAAQRWDERLKQLPAAAYGHAVEHELVFGSPRRALELARLNLAARPYGEARIQLAAALLANGMPQAALRQLAMAERSGWRSASLYAARAHAYDLLGKSVEGGEARKAAKALNPRIFAPETSLVWLSHG